MGWLRSTTVVDPPAGGGSLTSPIPPLGSPPDPHHRRAAPPPPPSGGLPAAPARGEVALAHGREPRGGNEQQPYLTRRGGGGGQIERDPRAREPPAVREPDVEVEVGAILHGRREHGRQPRVER